MDRKGFTIVELLGVIAVLAVLIVIAVPSVTTLLQRNKNKLTEETKKSLKDAAVTYVTQNIFLQKCDNKFEPTSINSTSKANCTTKIKVSTLVNENYFDDDASRCKRENEILVYRYINEEDGIDEIRSYIDENICEVK